MRVKVATDFTFRYEYSAPIAIEKIKILGAVLELPTKIQNSTANPAHLPEKWAKWAELAVPLSW